MTDFSKCKVLVVDDTEANIDILVETLGSDYDISVAMDGEDALEMVSEDPPDLILLDIMMPGMDGYEVCKRLKADENTKKIPIIFLTAMTEEQDEARGLALGAVDYVTKPFSPGLVKSRVQNQLELKLNRDDLEAAHKHTRESIEYASLIQRAVLPENNLFREYFKDYFAIWHPKDMVGGDIYFFEELRHKDECLLFFIDCTGHGVPGAFVTMLVKAVEKQIISKILTNPDMDVSPAWIMGYFNNSLKKLLKQENAESVSNAGWDGGIIYYNKKDMIIKFCGAETPLFFVDTTGKINMVKGNRYSVGYKKCKMDYEYKESILQVREGMKFYCTTDGYLDQNGGEKDFPFGKTRFKNIIKNYHNEPMTEQQKIFLSEMKKYEDMIPNNDRNDDMTLIGFTI